MWSSKSASMLARANEPVATLHSMDLHHRYRQAQRDTDRILQLRQDQLDLRRDKLHQLVLEEEEELRQALLECQDTPQERMAKMLQKLQQLRHKREAERELFIKEKRDQQFRNNTPELRPFLSQKIERQVFTERMEQLQIKKKLQEEELAREQMFAQLWKQDAEAKAIAELNRMETCRQRNKDTQAILLEQIRQLEAHRAAKRKLILEEAELMREQRRIMRLEEQYFHLRRKRRQEQHRRLLDKELLKKLERVHRELREDLELEKKMLDDIMGQTDGPQQQREAAERRKKELWEEQQRYRNYLAELAAKAQEETKAAEKVFQADNDAMWERREKEWQQWDQAREKLRCECISGTYEIIQDHLAKNRREQDQKELETQELKKSIEEYMKEEMKRQEEDKTKKAEYKRDLIGQMTQQNNALADQLAQLHQEWAQSREEERKFRARLQKEVNQSSPFNLHPVRSWAQKNKVTC